MKKLLLVLSVIGLLASCSSNVTESEVTESNDSTKVCVDTTKACCDTTKVTPSDSIK